MKAFLFLLHKQCRLSPMVPCCAIHGHVLKCGRVNEGVGIESVLVEYASVLCCWEGREDEMDVTRDCRGEFLGREIRADKEYAEAFA